MKSRLVRVCCPQCGYAAFLKKETYLVASFGGKWKEQLRSGAYFRYRCSKCGKVISYAHPLLYYDGEKRFVLLLRKTIGETHFQKDIRCVQVQSGADFVERLRILDDEADLDAVLRLKKRLQQRYPDSRIEYDCRENGYIWFLRRKGLDEEPLGVAEAKV